MRFIITFFASYILIILYVACSHSNTSQLKHITTLETDILKDQTYLNSIDINELNNHLKVAELNLLRLENKELDSISVELIYFQYRDYLNCINDIQKCIAKHNLLKKELGINTIQLSNIKLDYQRSNKERSDLDTHLIHETKLIQHTSKSIVELIDKFNNQSEQFDSLNKYIENIINEN
tara:strand:- start:493 stop:1029 length:537 start_codon:yes stop_codon:yes gene_type:complete